MKKRSLLKLLAINLIILSIMLVVIELLFGARFSSKNQLIFFGVRSNIDIQFEIDLYTDTMITVQHTRDQYGLRSNSAFNQPEKIDILTIGGSTTFQKYIDDSNTWEAHLQRKLQEANKDLKIASAGINGHSTHAHIKAFDLWFPTIENLKPKYIFFYIGINDYLPRPFLMAENTSTLKATLQDKSILYNTLRRAKGAYLARKNKFESLKVDFSKYEFTKKSLLTEEYREFYISEFVPSFKQRLQKLIELSLALGAEPIFITQPMALYKLSKGEISGVAYGREDFITGQLINGVDS